MAAILSAEQNNQRLQQSGLNTLLAERARREEVARENKLRQDAIKAASEEKLTQSMAEKRKQVQAREKAIAEQKAKEEAATIKFEREKELETLKASLRTKDIDPLERRKKELEVKKLEAELSDQEGLTPYQKETLDIKKQERQAKIQAEILDPDKPFSLSALRARQENQKADNNIYYLVKEPTGESDWIPFNDSAGDITPVDLPVNPKTGRRVTSQDIADTLEANPGMTEEDVLRAIGAI